MKKTNILLITTDQQHYGTLGVTNPRIRTPALDRLAGQGVRFDRAYCSNPTCSPSRASIITGLYPAWHHCWTIGVKLPEDVPTVGDLFQSHGYESILIGKAHFQPMRSEPGSESIEALPLIRDLDFWRGFHGPWYGFNHVETARMHGHQNNVGQHYALWMEEKGLTNWADYFASWPRQENDKYSGPWYVRDMLAWDLPEPLHHSHWVGERTVAHIERCAAEGRPFFLWSSFFDPHPPYVIPEPWASMYDPGEMLPGRLVTGELDKMPAHYAKTQEAQPDFSVYDEPGGSLLHGFHPHHYETEELQRSIACYYGMISLIDQEIAHILDCLDRLGIAQNTLILFSTDHGHFMGQHGLIAKGAFHYEDMLRIPMLVRYPKQVPAGAVSHALQSQVDWAPTFLAAAGIEVPGLMQGLDQMPVWSGDTPTVRDHVIVENRHNPTTMHLRTLVTERYKLTVYREDPYGELFDLDTDPEERQNRWDDPGYRDVKAMLLLRFVQAELEREPTRMPRIAVA
jgi:arylsulfatase A-like enzyme